MQGFFENLLMGALLFIKTLYKINDRTVGVIASQNLLV